MTAFIFLAVLLVLIALGMPIAFALLFSGVAVMFQMGQFDSQIVVQNAIGGADNFVLMAVPFFILAGEFMNAGGLSRRIVEMAGAFVGHLRGGLGYVAIFAAILLASLSGSAVADTAALAAILVPMMRRTIWPVVCPSTIPMRMLSRIFAARPASRSPIHSLSKRPWNGRASAMPRTWARLTVLRRT